MKYRKRPVVVEAEQWFPGKNIPGMFGHLEGQSRSIACLTSGCYDIRGPSVVTIHREVASVAPGDWVIQEGDGEHAYPCKPDVFEKIYEPVDEQQEDGDVTLTVRHTVGVSQSATLE